MAQSSLITRAVSGSELEVRTDGDGRTITGLAVRFGAIDEIGEVQAGYGFYESYDRHAFDRTIRERGPKGVRFLAHHNRSGNPLGVMTDLRADGAGLWMQARVSQTQAGDEFLTLVNDGAITDLSIGFRPVRDRWSRDKTSVVRLEVALREISAVTMGALADAKITGVRAATPHIIPDDAVQRRLRSFDL